MLATTGTRRRRRTTPAEKARRRNDKIVRALERMCMSKDDAKLAAAIQRHISTVLWATNGQISVAADVLGLHRRSLQRMIRRPAKRKKRRASAA